MFPAAQIDFLRSSPATSRAVSTRHLANGLPSVANKIFNFKFAASCGNHLSGPKIAHFLIGNCISLACLDSVGQALLRQRTAG